MSAAVEAAANQDVKLAVEQADDDAADCVFGQHGGPEYQSIAAHRPVAVALISSGTSYVCVYVILCLCRCCCCCLCLYISLSVSMSLCLSVSVPSLYAYHRLCRSS